ncbi:MAG: hypothetical protein CMF96_00600, partial [Candidatus Marinimicrobia bacterium]|nr:hypothetical protein [Candidatus Neomarinimicrobiota bacterium]
MLKMLTRLSFLFIIMVTALYAETEPVANAGDDQTIYIQHDGDPLTNTVNVTLDGSNSAGVSCNWSSSSNRDNLEGCEIQLTLIEGVYSYTLTVTGDDGTVSEPDDVTITVVAEPNQIPAAVISDPGEFQAEHSGNPLNDIASVFLDASTSSDADQDNITYLWNQISGNYIDLGTSNQSSLSFNAPPGVYGIRLTVTDSYGDFNQYEVTITVNQALNQNPTVAAGDDQNLEIEHDGDPNTIAVDAQV